MMIQLLEFDTVAIFGLSNMINGSDLDLGAHFYNKKKWNGLMGVDSLLHCKTKPTCDLISHLPRCEKFPALFHT